MDAVSGNQLGAGHQEGLAKVVDKIRADFAVVRRWFVRYGEWSADEASEVGAGIGEAVKAGDAGELAFWSDWTARMTECAQSHSAQMAALDASAAAWWMEQQRRAA